MKEIVPDYRLDMIGEPCPYPAVATLEALPQLKKGEILEVVSDCPQSINNIPLDAKNHGYTVLDNPKSIDDHYIIIPEQYGDDGTVTAEAVYGRVAFLTLSQPSVEAAVEHNRADIDFLAVMTGTDL